jgi:integrase/recombinase XerD
MTTIATYIERFLSDPAICRALSPATLLNYRSDLTAAARLLPAPLDDLTLVEIEGYLGHDRGAAATIARRAASLARFFRWACRHGLCRHNPLALREPIRVPRRLPRPIHTVGERMALDKALTTAPLPYKLIFILLRETGMRVGEVLALTVGDVLLDPGREGLHVREPKNQTERVVVLTAASAPRTLRGLRSWLKTLQHAGPHAPLFRSKQGTRVSYDAVRWHWQKVCAQAGLLNEAGKPRYTIHQLRHTRGTELVEQRQPLEIVQRVLGHRDIRSTQGYAALSDDQVRAALEQSRQR